MKETYTILDSSPFLSPQWILLKREGGKKEKKNISAYVSSFSYHLYARFLFFSGSSEKDGGLGRRGRMV